MLNYGSSKCKTTKNVESSNLMVSTNHCLSPSHERYSEMKKSNTAIQHLSKIANKYHILMENLEHEVQKKVIVDESDIEPLPAMEEKELSTTRTLSLSENNMI